MANRTAYQANASQMLHRRRTMQLCGAVGLGILAIAAESTPVMGHAQTAIWLREALHWHGDPGVVEALNAVLRKVGHLTGFGLLGLVLYHALMALCADRSSAFRQRIARHAGALGALGAGLVGTCDEIHQCFMPTRHGSAGDVLLDISGAALFIGFSTLLARRSTLRPRLLLASPAPSLS